MKAGRILAALCLGPVVGNLAAIPFAFAIDAAYGAEVTGGQWHLTIPNIIYCGIMGLLTGLFAGIIAGRAGWLIGALAQFIPLTLLTLAAVIRNRDFLSMSEVPPATWTWIGLLPAVVGGHLGERTLTWEGVPLRAGSDRSSHSDSYFRAVISVMKLNLLWYCPLVVSVLMLLVIPNARSGYHNVVLVFRRLSWGLLFSPSAYMFFTSLGSSLFVPLRLLLFMPLFFEPTLPNYKRRYWLSLGLVAVIVIADVVFKVFMWGSFPLLGDKNGYERLRLIPFFPWPDAPTFE